VSDAPATTPQKKPAPWRGRRRVMDVKEKFIAVRVTVEDRAKIAEAASEAGLSIGALLRSLALGSAGARAVKRPRAERVELARLLGELGKVGSNVNQIAKALNSIGRIPTPQELPAMQTDIAAMRSALMTALGGEP
jgi:Bacterial mobilisation protein (MobC)